MHVAAWPVLFALLIAFPSAYADNGDIEIQYSDYTFVDADGMTNVIGVVNNKGLAPISVVMALDVSDGSTTTTLQEDPYGRVMFPEKGAPFKFRVAPDLQVVGRPYVASVEQVYQPFYDALIFDYSNMAAGDEKMLVGRVTNTGPFPFYNVTVFASAHDEDMIQLDSSRSNVIPVIEPGQVAEFAAMPDDAVRDQVMYYSCAGFDPDAPIPTIPTGDGKFIAYNMQTVSKVSRLRYDNSTDSLSFGVTPYNPAGTLLALKFAQVNQNQTIAVLLDAQLYNASIAMDGRTVSVDMFVPPGDHEVQVQGVRALPEFPLAALGLAAMTATGIAAARFKAAFKIP